MEQIGEMVSQYQDGQTGQRYFVDLEWYKNNNRSFEVLVQNRMCPDSFNGWNIGASSGTSSTTPRSAAAIDEIERCCSKKPGFIIPNLTVMEILFRTLLTSGNQPLTLGEIEARIREWVGGWDGRVINEDVLKRLIAADDFYGIGPAPDADE
ncbi:MAG: hypothetical protein EXR50_05390 [Dehalococcoidia bacterium]|nr:hypothetical protein [Dehalococcoidia bacterium]